MYSSLAKRKINLFLVLTGENILFASEIQTHLQVFKDDGRAFQILIAMKEIDCFPTLI